MNSSKIYPMPQDIVEYKIIHVKNVTLDKQQHYLNKYAEQGWRVSAYIPEGLNIGNYVLEREKEYEFKFSSGFVKKYVNKSGKTHRIGPRIRILSQNTLIRFVHHCLMYGNWSLAGLAKEASDKTGVRIGESALNYWFRGQNVPKLNTLQAVLSVLGFSLTVVPIDTGDKEYMKDALAELDVEPVNDLEFDFHAAR